MSEKDNKNEIDENRGGESLFPDDMNPYPKDDPYYNTGLWPVLASGIEEWPAFEAPSAEKELSAKIAPSAEKSSSERQEPSGNPPPIVLPPEGPVDPKDMDVLFTERDARDVRFRNLITKGRHMMALGVDAAAEKYFRKAAEEGYHEANFQIALLRVNRVLQEEQRGGKPDVRDAGSVDVSGRRTMRKDLSEHFALMADSVFRYADEHMVFQTKEILEKAVSLGKVDSLSPEDAARGYRKMLKRHSETTWDIINYDESSAIQNLMVLLSVCRNADRYDMSGMLGVLLFKLKEFMATGEFEEFSKRSGAGGVESA